MRTEGKIAIFGEHEEGALVQIRRACAPDIVARGVLCADGHKGYAVPIGGVVAYRDAISPSGVGYDIACGNKAARLDIGSDGVHAVKQSIKLIMDDVFEHISFGVGRKNQTEVDHPLLESFAWRLPAIAHLKELARQQLGTVGSGNHYVDILDELGRIWVGVHFGSRGFGHKTATYFLKQAGASDGMDADPAVISTDTTLGQDYLTAMTLAGEYAYAGRDWVCDTVAKIIGAPIVEEVHNHHNFAWKEQHNGESLWVVRKGATPAFPGQRGFVGGTMGENSVILEGVEHLDNALTLSSTIHGAGRVMGRMEAKGKIDRKTGEVKRAGKVTQEMMDTWVRSAGIELRGAGLDESPHCYNRLCLPWITEHGRGLGQRGQLVVRCSQ